MSKTVFMMLLDALEKQSSLNIFTKRATILTPLFMGTGIAYSIENNKYHYIPIALILPTPFIGGVLYYNRYNLKDEYKKIFIGRK